LGRGRERGKLQRGTSAIGCRKREGKFKKGEAISRLQVYDYAQSEGSGEKSLRERIPQCPKGGNI